MFWPKVRAVKRVVVLLLATLSAAAALASPPKPDLTKEPKKPTDPTPTKQNATPLEVKGPWYSGPYGKNRIENLAFTGALGAYLGAAALFKFSPTPSSANWTSVPGFDAGIRRALVWNNTSRADTWSGYETYYISPVVGLALLVASDRDASTTRLIDDLLPVVETVAVVQVATQFAKYAFARERPYLHYDDKSVLVGSDANSSFWSGHSSFGFALTSAAGTVCHFRHYWTEPYVWAAGITLSVSAEYLRIAADKHYASDVVVGGLVGIGAGLLVPRLMQRAVKIVPVKNGVALAGSF
jgi:membrane-associated phospholipid phosphatase